ncbi:hypothetical protein STEG23_034353 [Scotinomys teguina]
MIPNSEAKQIIIENCDNANVQHKRLIRTLNARLTPLEEWIRDTINIESHNHDDAWIKEEVPPRDPRITGPAGRVKWRPTWGLRHGNPPDGEDNGIPDA